MNGTVSTGSPVTRKVPANVKAVAIVLNASGGPINCTYQIDDDSPIPVEWSPGELADGTSDSTRIDFNITSFTVTGDGTFNYRFLY